MKIDILSDLHLDFYLKPQKTEIGGSFERRLHNLLDKSEDVEVLIVAGDLTHYNQQIEILKDIAKQFNYKKVFCVLGNHDLYLVSQSQRNKYKNSQGRLDAWYSYHDDSGVVQILNGVVEYKGVKFGGTMGWYDGSYLKQPGMYNSSIKSEWQAVMNDSRLIYGLGDLYDMGLQFLPKINEILDVDVVITHFCPLANPVAFQTPYKYEPSSKFYAFDGEHYLQKTRAKYWVYGHSHGNHDFEVHGTKVLMNALGYPNEIPPVPAKPTQIEVI